MKPPVQHPGDAPLLGSASPKECKVIRKTIQTDLTTHFIYCIKLSKICRAEFEPVCKQAPIHSWVPKDSTLFHFLMVRDHVSAALQGVQCHREEVNQQPPKSCKPLHKLFCRLQLPILPEQSLFCDTVWITTKWCLVTSANRRIHPCSVWFDPPVTDGSDKNPD